MRLKFIATASTLAIFAIILALNPTTTKLFQPPSISGAYDQLHTSAVVPTTGAVGPESIAFDPHDGGPYAGVADGRILKWNGDQLGWSEFAVTTSLRQPNTIATVNYRYSNTIATVACYSRSAATVNR